MNNFFRVISSYNIFNYLIPGAVFSFLISRSSRLNLVEEDLFVSLIIYYFTGLAISRCGSLIIQPILTKVNLINFADYKDYISASGYDEKIELFSEVNNMYRTFISMVLILVLFQIYFYIEEFYPAAKEWSYWVFLILLLILFIASYRKQTDFIKRRVKASSSKKSD